MLFHDGIALCCDAVEEVDRVLIGGFDEVYERIGALGALVEASYA